MLIAKDRRLGRFDIPRTWINQIGLEALAAFTAPVLVLKAEYAFERDAIHYLAWAPFFDLSPVGAAAPFYYCHLEKGVPTWTHLLLPSDSAEGAPTPKFDYMAAVRDSAKAQ